MDAHIPPLIAEDLLLLLLDDETGKLHNATWLELILGGGVLVDLAARGAVVPGPKTGWTKQAKVLAADTPPTLADPVLAHAFATVMEKPRSGADLVRQLGKNLKPTLLDRLAAAGVLRREDGKVLGLFPRTVWPTADAAHERELRRRIGDVLVRGVTPDQHTAAVIAVLSSAGIAEKVIDREGLSAKELRQRAKQLAEGDWAIDGVKDAIAAANAAVMAAITASTAAATISST